MLPKNTRVISRKMRLIDIGVNLTDGMFRGEYRGKRAHADDFASVMERARKAGVERMIITGGSLSESIEALSLAESDAHLYTTVGCHPTRCGEFDKHKQGPDHYYEQLRDLIRSHSLAKKIVAIGECGLGMQYGCEYDEIDSLLRRSSLTDYDRTHFCPISVQKKYFLRQFDLAEETGLPMFLHSRNTGNDFNDMIKANRTKFKHGVVHSFTGTVQEMQDLVSMNLHIGVNGCSMKAEENIEVVKAIPANLLMLETDAPWCDIRPTHASYQYWKNCSSDLKELYTPEGKKKEKFEMGLMVKSRNEPCTMGQVLHIVAAIRGVDPNELAEQVWENTCNVFFP
ncbi:putative deoxyribonuclease TATDN1-like protein [Umbelopsis sp. AD052]|nr:putative deoxyribonuclease TATDN1-like protein [Umbelopsis sp. AD052]